MHKRYIGNNTEKTAYFVALKRAIEDLQISEIQINLLIDYFVNEESIEQLSKTYHQSVEKIQELIQHLQYKLLTSEILNEEREKYHLKGNHKKI